MISWPWLSAITHVTSCPEREIDITTAGASPIIFPTATYKQKPIKMHPSSVLSPHNQIAV